MFDELESAPGLINTVELGMDLHLMDAEGDLWRRTETDWTRDRYFKTLMHHAFL